MRQTLFLIIAVVIFSCSGNGSEEKRDVVSEDNGMPVITFEKIEHDFGTITEGENVGTIFRFTNTGDAPLIISSAATSCGCTVPKFSNKPVAPGESGTLEVVFDSSHREGKQTKTISVRSNAEPQVIVLRITADIVTK
ncbi:MAG: DUF1573 domain-containing protein [Bacteroidales bacterium]|nr:DUF1573 domain-containing protein [Bacteroidales bacterium]